MGLTPGPPGQEWPQVFRRLIVTNSRHWLNQARDDTTQILSEVPQILKGLHYALDLPEARQPARDLMLLLSPTLARRGLDGEWQSFLSKAVARSREEQDPAEIELRLALATFYRLRGQLSEAGVCLQEALLLCGEDRTSPHYWTVINHLARVARLAADHQQALAHCQQVFAEQNLPLATYAEALNVMGLVAHDRRQWAEALTYFEQGLSFYRSLGDPYQVARLLTNRGIILRRLERWDEAEVSYREAASRFQEAGDNVERFKAVTNLGNSYLMRADYQAAIEQYQKALPIFEQYRYLIDQAGIYNNLGMAYTGIADWEMAKVYFNASVGAWRKLADPYNQANVLDNLAKVFMNVNRFKQAGEAWRQALQILNTAPDTPFSIFLKQKVEERLADLKKAKNRKRCRINR